MSAQRRTTAAAHPNLALVKYWGQRDAALNLPANDSLSVNLSGATTTTTVTFDEALAEDAVFLNDEVCDPVTCARVSAHLHRVRALAGIETFARVDSHNDFPLAAGVASSASAFAALSLAATRAVSLDLDERALSILARKGSGSACRSIPGGFVEWLAGESDAESYARQVAPPEHWDLRILTVTFDVQPKDVSSLEGHRAALTSPFFTARLTSVRETLRTVRSALLDRDFAALGCAAEREALSLHAVAMTSRVEEKPWLSGILYWQPETVALLRSVQTWRQEGLPVYFSLDAGASVHLLCEAEREPQLEEVLEDSLSILGGSYISSAPGRGAWLVG